MLKMFTLNTVCYLFYAQVLAHTLVNSTQQARQFVTQQKLKRELAKRDEQELDASLHKFKSVACGILNIDETQLDDIMHAEKVDATKVNVGVMYGQYDVIWNTAKVMQTLYQEVLHNIVSLILYFILICLTT